MMQENTKYNIPSEISSKISKWLAKFPIDQKKPAIIYALHLIQHENKYIRSEHVNAVADFLGLKKIDVYEVASFYSMFETEQVGKHTISVCTNVSCMLNGSDEILKYLEDKLKMKVGDSSEKYFLKDERECLAACCGAPMMQVNYDYYEDLSKNDTEKILDSFLDDKPLKPGSFKGRKSSAPYKVQKNINGSKNA